VSPFVCVASFALPFLFSGQRPPNFLPSHKRADHLIPHAGGALLVTHRGHTNTFDWSSASTADSETSTSPAQIKWAAFYSDCSHEVQPVVTGHRVTLTYNLYVSPHSVGSLFTLPPSVDAASYPLSAGAREMLSQNGFMPEGGTLGFYCTHQYAHATSTKAECNHQFGDTADFEQLMPYALKGVDAMLFQTFASLGVNVTVKPVIDSELFEDFYEDVWIGDEEDAFEGETEDQKMVRVGEMGLIPRVGKKFWALQFEENCYGGGDVWRPHEVIPPALIPRSILVMRS
jgi:hypothetical protein